MLALGRLDINVICDLAAFQQVQAFVHHAVEPKELNHSKKSQFAGIPEGKACRGVILISDGMVVLLQAAGPVFLGVPSEQVLRKEAVDLGNLLVRIKSHNIWRYHSPGIHPCDPESTVHYQASGRSSLGPGEDRCWADPEWPQPL